MSDNYDKLKAQKDEIVEKQERATVERWHPKEFSNDGGGAVDEIMHWKRQCAEAHKSLKAEQIKAESAKADHISTISLLSNIVDMATHDPAMLTAFNSPLLNLAIIAIYAHNNPAERLDCDSIAKYQQVASEQLKNLRKFSPENISHENTDNSNVPSFAGMRHFKEWCADNDFSEITGYKKINSGEISAVKIDRSLYITNEEHARWMASLPPYKSARGRG